MVPTFEEYVDNQTVSLQLTHSYFQPAHYHWNALTETLLIQ
ncbi:MAG: hypothetical protein ACI9DG_001770 [Oleispira sp.]|jgi:hypothetical protein